MRSISRRSLLGASAATLSLAQAPAAPRVPNEKKLKVVVSGAHPGDPEYGCGGTIARYTDAGHEVTILYLNRGEGGCPAKSGAECGALRSSEARRACEILKARPIFAGQIDGRAVIDNDRYEEFRKILEAENPDIVFAHWPIDNHRDHRAISSLAYDAWLHGGKRFAFYYYEVSTGEDTWMFAPAEYVDIATTEPRKRAACYAHASQAPDHFYALQSQIARFRGVESGFSQAEAFTRHVQSRSGLLPGELA